MIPWISIWTEPRATTRAILGSDPKSAVALLAALEGVFFAFNLMPQYLIQTPPPAHVISPDSLWLLALFLLVSGPAFFVFFWYVGAFFLRWTGSWLGGIGNEVHIRAATAWGYIPSMAALGVGGLAGFLAPFPNTSPTGLQIIALLFLSLASIVLNIWAVVVSCKCLAEAQGFSAWRAMVNYVLATIFLMAIVLLPTILLVVVYTVSPTH